MSNTIIVENKVILKGTVNGSFLETTIFLSIMQTEGLPLLGNAEGGAKAGIVIINGEQQVNFLPLSNSLKDFS